MQNYISRQSRTAMNRGAIKQRPCGAGYRHEFCKRTIYRGATEQRPYGAFLASKARRFLAGEEFHEFNFN